MHRSMGYMNEESKEKCDSRVLYTISRGAYEHAKCNLKVKSSDLQTRRRTCEDA